MTIEKTQENQGKPNVAVASKGMQVSRCAVGGTAAVNNVLWQVISLVCLKQSLEVAQTGKAQKDGCLYEITFFNSGTFPKVLFACGRKAHIRYKEQCFHFILLNCPFLCSNNLLLLVGLTFSVFFSLKGRQTLLKTKCSALKQWKLYYNRRLYE